MFTTRKDITSKLIGFAVKNYQKVIKNSQERRIKKHRTQLQAVLMLSSIKRIK